MAHRAWGEEQRAWGIEQRAKGNNSHYSLRGVGYEPEAIIPLFPGPDRYSTL